MAGKVIVFGDSLLKNITPEGATHKLIFARGLTTDRLIHRIGRGDYDQDIRNCRGIIVLLGTNNLREDKPEKIVEDLSQIRALLTSKNRSITVTLSTLVPRKDEWEEKAKLTSNLLSAKAKTKNWTISQTHKTFLKKKNQFKPLNHPDFQKKELLDPDLYHLSHYGETLLKNYIINYIDRHFKVK